MTNGTITLAFQIPNGMKSRRGRFSIIDEVATRILILVLLSTSLTYGQSFIDTSIAGGISSEREPYGAMEMRYNQQLIRRVYASASMNFSLDGFENNLNLFSRFGGTIALAEGWTVTIGSSIESATRFWKYEPYLRTDHRVYNTDRGSINIIIDIQSTKGMIGISFKDFVLKQDGYYE